MVGFQIFHCIQNTRKKNTVPKIQHTIILKMYFCHPDINLDDAKIWYQNIFVKNIFVKNIFLVLEGVEPLQD